MPYCPECGNKTSITDKRCSKCGTKLMETPTPDPSHHNIEFALAIISIVLWGFAISISINDYFFVSSGELLIVVGLLAIGIIGAIGTRYYAKPGAITVLIVGLIFVILGISDIFWPMVFSVITLIVAFYLN